MKRGTKNYVGERKATRDNEENERLREKIKVQIVPWVKIKKHEGRKENVKEGNKGFRGEIKGTRAEEENKRCR